MAKKIIDVEIQGDNLNCDFELRPTGIPNEVQHYSNVTLAHFAVNSGQEYTLKIRIVGANGTKYKLVISNAGNVGGNGASYTLSGSEDILAGTFIA